MTQLSRCHPEGGEQYGKGNRKNRSKDPHRHPALSRNQNPERKEGYTMNELKKLLDIIKNFPHDPPIIY